MIVKGELIEEYYQTVGVHSHGLRQVKGIAESCFISPFCIPLFMLSMRTKIISHCFYAHVLCYNCHAI